MAIPPWHMWGGSAIIEIARPDNAIGSATASAQLARVSHKHPENWVFFLGMRLLEGPPCISNTVVVKVDFEITMGVGRTSYVANPFATLAFEYPVGPAPAGKGKWTTTTLSPPLSEGAIQVPAQPMTSFPAQDIQCLARLTIGAMGIGTTPMRVECTSFFSPQNGAR